MLQNNLSATGLSRGISFFSLLWTDSYDPVQPLPLSSSSSDHSTPPASTSLLVVVGPLLTTLFALHSPLSPFSLLCLRTLSSFLLSFAPRFPRQSALSVLLFYCGLPRCCLVSSVSPDLRLFRYLLRIDCALRMLLTSYRGRYSPIGSRLLEPALIPLRTPQRSSNHTIYTAPLPVSSL